MRLHFTNYDAGKAMIFLYLSALLLESLAMYFTSLVPQLYHLYLELNSGYHVSHWGVEIINRLIIIKYLKYCIFNKILKRLVFLFISKVGMMIFIHRVTINIK